MHRDNRKIAGIDAGYFSVLKRETDDCGMKIRTKIGLGIILFSVLISVIGLSAGAKENTPAIINAVMEVVQQTIIRDSPNKEATQDGTLKEGEEIMVLTKSADGWYQILYRGKVSYVESSCLETLQLDTELAVEMEKAEQEMETLSSDEVIRAVENGIITEGAVYEKIIAEKKKENKERLSGIVIILLLLIAGVSGISYVVLHNSESDKSGKTKGKNKNEDNKRGRT